MFVLLQCNISESKAICYTCLNVLKNFNDFYEKIRFLHSQREISTIFLKIEQEYISTKNETESSIDLSKAEAGFSSLDHEKMNDNNITYLDENHWANNDEDSLLVANSDRFQETDVFVEQVDNSKLKSDVTKTNEIKFEKLDSACSDNSSDETLSLIQNKLKNISNNKKMQENDEIKINLPISLECIVNPFSMQLGTGKLNNEGSKFKRRKKIKTKVKSTEKLKSKSCTENDFKKTTKFNSEQIALEDEQIRSIITMKCDLCDVEFNIFRDCKSHYRTVHNMQGYLKCCGSKFLKRVRAIEHLQRHINPDGFRQVSFNLF